MYVEDTNAAKGKKLKMAPVGGRTQLECIVPTSDLEEVTLWWQFQGQNLSLEGNHHNILIEKTLLQSINSLLTIDKVELADEGIYSCLAKKVASEEEPAKQEIELRIIDYCKKLFKIKENRILKEIAFLIFSVRIYFLAFFLIFSSCG